jgi:hypothetical protein
LEKGFAGKKILYVAPRFFGYEAEIENELTRQGAHVSFLLDRPFDSPFLKAMTKVCRGAVIGAADKYYREGVTKFVGLDFDYLFVVNGQTLSNSTLSAWKELYPAAKFVLYMWDSFGNRKWAIENLAFFDHAFTFDAVDAKKYNINFRPLFFSSGFEKPPQQDFTYDISFVGTAHTDRYSVISKVEKSLPVTSKKYWYLYLQAKWVYWFYRFTNSAFRSSDISNFEFTSITKSEVQSVFNNSKVILDVEHPNQTGLTIRTLETLGARKKLITTNASVKSYDFYKESNICIIDRGNPVVPDDFLDSPYQDVSEKIYHRYRLAGWMEDIIEVVTSK